MADGLPKVGVSFFYYYGYLVSFFMSMPFSFGVCCLLGLDRLV